MSKRKPNFRKKNNEAKPLYELPFQLAKRLGLSAMDAAKSLARLNKKSDKKKKKN